MSSVPIIPQKDAKRLRIDRSKYYSTVHGERVPGDPESQVHFRQDGLPFDAEGCLVYEAVPAEKIDEVDRRLKKLGGASRVPTAKVQETKPNAVIVADDDDEGAGGEGSKNDDGNPNNSDDVNLEQWIRGERRFQWFAVAAAIRARYNKNVNNQADAVTFLVEEGLVTEDKVAESFKKFLG